MIEDRENVCCTLDPSGLGGGWGAAMVRVYYNTWLRGTSAEALWHLLFYQPTQSRNPLL